MTYNGYIKDHPAYCLDHQCRKFHVLKCIMIERKFQALSWQRKKKSFSTDDPQKNPIRQIRFNDRLNINADMQINISDLKVADLSSHEGSTKVRHFWFQYHVRHLSGRTVLKFWSRFLHPNSAKNFEAQRDRELRPQISFPT